MKIEIAAGEFNDNMKMRREEIIQKLFDELMGPGVVLFCYEDDRQCIEIIDEEKEVLTKQLLDMIE
tara:strand:- start:255 stop:452 length:198 start_codon:yes stop_codon:yes gene_type:complete